MFTLLTVLMLAISGSSLRHATAQGTPPACGPPPAASPVADIGAVPEIPPVTAPPDAVDVAMGYIPVSIFAPVFVAYEKGYFAEQGLDVTLEQLPGGSDIVLQTATGELDLGISGTGPAFWNAASQDLGVKIIAPGHAEGSPVATPLMISTRACQDGSISSVADLAGKRVAVNAPGATEFWLDAALQTGGLSIADVDLEFLSFPDAVVALGSGALDAAMIGEPLATRAEQEGLAVRLLPDFPVQDIQPTMIFGNESWLESNPEAAAKFVAGYLRASRDLTTNFNDPLHLAIIQKYTDVPPQLIAESVKPVYSTDGEISLESLSLLQDFFRERGQLDYDENLDPATLVDTQYVDAANTLLGQ
jgi:NitT/TauT family transport system substrate-binding protein